MAKPQRVTSYEVALQSGMIHALPYVSAHLKQYDQALAPAKGRTGVTHGERSIPSTIACRYDTAAIKQGCSSSGNCNLIMNLKLKLTCASKQRYDEGLPQRTVEFNT